MTHKWQGEFVDGGRGSGLTNQASGAATGQDGEQGEERERKQDGWGG